MDVQQIVRYQAFAIATPFVLSPNAIVRCLPSPDGHTDLSVHGARATADIPDDIFRHPEKVIYQASRVCRAAASSDFTSGENVRFARWYQ